MAPCALMLVLLALLFIDVAASAVQAKSSRNFLQRHRHRHRHNKLLQSLLSYDRKKVKGEKRSFCDDQDGFVKEWADEFDGDALDSSFWQVIESQQHQGDHTAVVSGLGVTACRTAACRAENVQVRGGKLYLHSHRNASNYFTGAVTTKGKLSWADSPAYRICISAKLPGTPGQRGKGIWPAHWMLPDNGISDKCLDEGEMDIMEMINSDGGVYSTFHWLSSWPKRSCGNFETFHKSKNRLTRMPSDWNRAFHEYAVERSGEHMAFLVDGKVALNFSAAEAGAVLSHTPFFLILNTAVGGGWPGEPTSATALPAEHVIDYVRVSRRSSGGRETERHRRGIEMHDSDEEMPVSLAEVGSVMQTMSKSPPPMSIL